jgi:hypothetical protein
MSEQNSGGEPKHFRADLSETMTPQDQVQTKVDRATEVVQEALAGLTISEKKQVAVRSGLLPDQPTTNALWRWIVLTFCAVAGVSALAIAFVGLGTKLDGGSPNAQTLLTVFTTTVGFLGGLFAPSPVGKDGM